MTESDSLTRCIAPDGVRDEGSKGAARSVVFFIPDLGGGGAERVVVNLVNHFVADGVFVTLVLARAEGPLLNRLDDRVHVEDLGATSRALVVPYLARYLRRARPHCLISHMDVANVAACAAQLLSGLAAHRLVLCSHVAFSANIAASTRLKRRALAYAMRTFYPIADQLVAVSSGVANDLVKIARVTRQRVSIVYNPAYDASIERDALEAVDHPWLSEQSRDVPTLIAVGRLAEQKDYPTLLLAIKKIAEHRTVRLIILGIGPLESTLRSQVADLGLGDHVNFVGFKDNPFAFIARADVFVLTSRWEGFGNVIVEALACGTPVVSTNCPSGPAEILNDGEFGRLAAIGDVESVSRNILEALNEPRDEKRLKKRARHFSTTRAARAYLDIINAG